MMELKQRRLGDFKLQVKDTGFSADVHIVWLTQRINHGPNTFKEPKGPWLTPRPIEMMVRVNGVRLLDLPPDYRGDRYQTVTKQL